MTDNLLRFDRLRRKACFMSFCFEAGLCDKSLVVIIAMGLSHRRSSVVFICFSRFCAVLNK